MSEKLRLQEPIRSPLETPRLITPLPYRSGTSFLAWAIVNNNQPVPDVFSKMTKIAASGRLGLAAKGDFRGQFQKVFANLGDVLSGLGGGFDSVAKFTTYLVHSQDIELFMGERQKLFKDIYPDGICPPNTLLVVDRLVKEDFLIEIEAIAIIDRP